MFGNRFKKSPNAMQTFNFKSVSMKSLFNNSNMKFMCSLQNFSLMHMSLHNDKIDVLYKSLFFCISLFEHVKMLFEMFSIKGMKIEKKIIRGGCGQFIINK